MIRTLKVHQFRNLQTAFLSLADCNVLIGQNGSGKTSLLEAVFLLSRGKSFRHHEPKRYVSHAKSSCAVWADTSKGELAVQKTLDNKGFAITALKKDGQTVPAQSELSLALPVCLLDPSGMTLLEEGSHARRQLLDWAVFHVKREFYGEWLAHQRILKQRNGLLKSPRIQQCLDELVAWDYQLSVHAHRLSACRQVVFDEWQGYFGALVGQFLPKYQHQLTLGYQAGFDEALGLLQVLKARLSSDIELGYTRVGAHRADVLVGLSGEHRPKEQAVNVLSRGEKKLLICALKLSQLQLLCDKGLSPIVLLDDIDAELDEQALESLLGVLLGLPCQLFITSLDGGVIDKIDDIARRIGANKKVARFAVQDGVITRQE